MGGFPEIGLREPLLCPSVSQHVCLTPRPVAAAKKERQPPLVSHVKNRHWVVAFTEEDPSINVILHLSSISSISDCHRPRLGAIYPRRTPHYSSVTSLRSLHRDSTMWTRLSPACSFSTCPVSLLTHFPQTHFSGLPVTSRLRLYSHLNHQIGAFFKYSSNFPQWLFSASPINPWELVLKDLFFFKLNYSSWGRNRSKALVQRACSKKWYLYKYSVCIPMRPSRLFGENLTMIKKNCR